MKFRLDISMNRQINSDIPVHRISFQEIKDDTQGMQKGIMQSV